MFKEDAKVASKPTKVEVYIERLIPTLVKWLWRQSMYTQKKIPPSGTPLGTLHPLFNLKMI